MLQMMTPCNAILCAINEKVESNTCVACPVGTTNEAGDDASGCCDTTCNAILCAINEKVESNTCVACQAGTTNEAGDDASGCCDTTCDAIPTD